MRGGIRLPSARTLFVGGVPDISGLGIRLQVDPGSLSTALPSKWPDHLVRFGGVCRADAPVGRVDSLESQV